MKAQRRTKVIILSTTALVVLVIVIALQTMAASPVSGADQPRSPALDPSATPGIEVEGEVRQANQVGVAGVDVYMGFACCGGNIIATTDPTGHYQSDFHYIPGDELIRVWAEKPVYVFSPTICYWQHYYSHEHSRCDFTIFPPWFTFIPIMMPEGGLP